LIFYGKRERLADPAVLIHDATARLEAAASLGPGLARHEAAMAAFLVACEAIQGLADHVFARDGEDRPYGPHAALGPWALDIARSILASWEADFAALPPIAPPPIGLPLPPEVTIRQCEGFAFYAVYPEAHALAARRLPPAAENRVLGIRSIGVALGVMAAAALGAPPPVTVRPVGHPFDRRVAIDAGSFDTGCKTARLVIADEGPGLSGSSFAAAWRAAREAGVPDELIAFLPSHHGAPGPQAGEAARAAWAGRVRAALTFDEALGTERLRAWTETLLGPLDGPLIDIAGGRWRALRHDSPERWPMADPARERLKFLAVTRGRRWLVKFAGLGDEGARKLDRACALSKAGLGPSAAGLVHGFLVQEWVEGRPVDGAEPGDVDQVARYVGRRAALLAPPPHAGATPARLIEMAEHNVREALGAAVAGRIPWRRHASHLISGLRPCAIDGRLDLCEWVRTAGGRLVKVDALDHDAAHDLIGPQDVAWDVAGAKVEWDLDDYASTRLVRTVADETRQALPPERLAGLIPCYLAFRLGAAQLATEAAAGTNDATRARARMIAYAARLERLSRA
jgi:hypothetical protein